MFYKLLQFITWKQRYPVKIDWFAGGIFHFLFRIPEFLFGRKFGIRPEMSSRIYTDKNGKEVVEYSMYSWEAVFCHSEGMFYIYAREKIAEIKSKIKQWEFKVGRLVPQFFDTFNPMPQFSVVGYGTIPKRGEYPKGYLFAIAVDASSKVAVGANNQARSWSHTTTGSNTIMFNDLGATFSSSNPGITSVTGTYNSVSLTTIYTATNTGSYAGDGFMYLIAPTTGTNTVYNTMVIGGGDWQLTCAVVTYSGAKQTSPIDSSAKQDSYNTQTVTATTTVVGSNCWLVGLLSNGNQSPLSYGGVTTARQTQIQYGTLVDSNGTVGTGTQTLSATYYNSAGSDWIVASFLPAPASAVNSGFLGFF